MSASVAPVRGHVRLVAGVALIGWDEVRALSFALSAAVAIPLGVWLGGIAHAALGLWA